MHFPFVFLSLFANLAIAAGRSWRDIELIHEIDISDQIGLYYLEQTEESLIADTLSERFKTLAPYVEAEQRFAITDAPSPSPSAMPSLVPTTMPSSVPTVVPTVMPTVTPTSIPSAEPSAAPSLAPTTVPTQQPDPYPDPETPKNPDKSYFNYDDSTRYGPDDWGSVENPKRFYWDEFDEPGRGAWKGLLEKRDPSKNMCERGDLQSPIDVRENGAVCNEFHEVRSKQGDFKVKEEHVEKRIESNKLRLLYDRRNCADLNNVRCQEPDPPYADFPYGWGGTADVIHIDFKIPSEHTIWGERFDAEMQIVHLHPERKRVATLAVVIRASDDGYNYYFQEALDAFQDKYDENAANCARRLRTNTSPLGQKFSNITNLSKKQDDRDLQKFSGVWDPHHEMLVPTIHFWRYDGSLTEPPCGEFVSWWIADKPMKISFEQLEQMKNIQFTNVDSKCKKTSVHFEHGNVRPIQKTNGRPVYRCTWDDFGPDK